MAATVVTLLGVRAVEPLQTGDPRRIGSYLLLGRLGEGGMGQVFLGASPGGRKVAVKVMHSAYTADPEFRRRFAREVAAARRVGGFHTALVVDADPDADSPWMVTAYIPGPSLAAAVAEHGPLDVDAVRELGAALAEGLAAIHGCGLIHRDLKPSNIIMAHDGPRIIDFGIARSTGASTITSQGTLIGSWPYMSPEQLDSREITAQSDVFSLGGVLTFAATGHGAFDPPDFPAIVSRILTQPPDLAPLSGSLHDVISSCLAKDPAARPSLTDLLAYFVTEESSAPLAPRAARNTVPSKPARQAHPGSPPAGQPTASLVPPRQALPAPSTADLTRPADLIPVSPPLDHREVTRVTFSPDGRLLATASEDMTVRLWDTATWQPTGPPLPKPFHFTLSMGYLSGPLSLQMRFAPDSRVLLTILDGGVLLWDTVTHQEIEPPLRVRGTTLRASPDGRLLAAASGGTLLLWNTSTGQHATLHLEKQSVKTVQFRPCIAFSADGHLLAANDSKGDVHLWDTATSQPTARLRRPRGKFSIKDLTLQSYFVSEISLSPDGRLLAVLGRIGRNNREYSIHLRDIPTHRRPSKQLIETDVGPLSPLAFSPDSSLLAVAAGGLGNSLRLWDTTTRRYTDLQGNPGNSTKVMFSPDGRLFAATGYTTILWDTTSYQPAAAGPRVENFDFIRDAAFSPDSRLLATADGTIVRVWELP